MSLVSRKESHVQCLGEKGGVYVRMLGLGLGCARVCVCMRVCACMRLYVCAHVRAHVPKCVCVRACVLCSACVCTRVCVYQRVHASGCASEYALGGSANPNLN